MFDNSRISFSSSEGADNLAPSRWQQYLSSYRTKEVREIAGWITRGECGSVVGLPGTGRATLLGFLCHRPDALATYLPPALRSTVLIPVDLNVLPDSTPASFYRVILRSFYHARHHFSDSASQAIVELYRKNEAIRDPFVPQSALLELMTLFQAQAVRVVWVLNRFDQFCRVATPYMIRTLRSLYDNFQGTLCYIVGMRQEIVYVSDLPAIDPLYRTLDTHVCWVKPLNEIDARDMLARELHEMEIPMSEEDIASLWRLTSGYPVLIKIAYQWWLSTVDKPPYAQWAEALLNQQAMRHRLERIWRSLSQEERLTLSELQKSQIRSAMQDTVELVEFKKRQKQIEFAAQQHYNTLRTLQAKGICYSLENNWHIFSELFARYIPYGEGRGRIWLDEETGNIFQGQSQVQDIQPLERAVLHFFIKHPNIRHTHTSIIEAAWPDEVVKTGVSTEALYQIIRGIRKKIEPNPGTPVYVMNWRGQREGGYQFFGEGRPS